jgi:hypothetical protein
MKIKHAPLLDTKKVEELYSEKDGVPISYVCTTDLNASDNPLDIFYRETPHPEFGNRYFGLYYSTETRLIRKRHMMITNADTIESFDFGMIQDAEGEWWYSQSHHDCLMIDGKMIDGGRVYVRGNGIEIFKIRDGKFVTLAEAEVADGIDLPGMIPETPDKPDDWPDFVENFEFR